MISPSVDASTRERYFSRDRLSSASAAILFRSILNDCRPEYNKIKAIITVIIAEIRVKRPVSAEISAFTSSI